MRKLTLLVAGAAVLFAAILALMYGEFAPSFVWSLSQGGSWLLPLVVVAALLDSINPCAFSILLLTIAFLFSIGRVRSEILAIGGAYLAGIFLAYMLIGLGLLGALHIFSTPHFMAKIGAALLIAFGAVSIIGEFFPSFPLTPRIPHAAHRAIAGLMAKISLPTAFLLGGLVGLCEFPCTGGPYLLVIGLLKDTATYAAGIGYLLLYNLIFVLPLVIILLISGNAALVERVRVLQREKRRGMRLWGGAVMILLGGAIFLL
ncbi:MAG: cytochrome c biogenesis protein CcdA [bacterium]|nr:cytochrome c biogenesis protein CcdA [bacterium]